MQNRVKNNRDLLWILKSFRVQVTNLDSDFDIAYQEKSLNFWDGFVLMHI